MVLYSTMSNATKTTTIASANWLALKKTLDKSTPSNSRPHKRRKVEHGSTRTLNTASLSPAPSTSTHPSIPISAHEDHTNDSNFNASLQNMVKGALTYTPTQHLPGRYLAIDCEMVGVGLNDGEESSLARVSLVNWHGAVQLDVFVRQRERVVDYRTQWSGVREKDMVGAKPFVEVQKLVADMLKDRILIGHAIHNDLKALLLSHPHQMTRDTQIYARKHGLTKSKYIALRTLVNEQLGLAIQEGEHSSVTDARAAMAIYRLHKKEWEKGMKPIDLPTTTTTTTTPTANAANKKRKRESTTKGKVPVHAHEGNRDEDDNAAAEDVLDSPRKQRKGISSGLSTIIKRRGSDHARVTKLAMRAGKAKTTTSSAAAVDGKTKKAWWAELPPSLSLGPAKGSIRLKTSGG